MSFGRVELEIEDRDQPDRHIVAEMSLNGFEWKLTRLIVKSVPIQDQIMDDEARQMADDIKNGRLYRTSQSGA